MVTDAIRPEDFESATLPVETNGHLLFREEDKPQVDVYWLYGVPRVMGLYGRCAVCDGGGKYTVDADKGVVRIDEPCPIPEGITTVITLAVPSGKILVEDELHIPGDWREVPEKKFASYSSRLGQAQAIEHMASIGCAYGPVGNSCPGLYRTGEGTYAIASGTTGDDDELIPELAHWTRLASICTDVWTYSVVDYGRWLEEGGREVTEEDPWADVAEVPPGLYEFTHHTGRADFEHYPENGGPVVFADIRRVGDIP